MGNNLKQEFILVHSGRGHSLAWQGRHGAKSRRKLINYITQSGSRETHRPSWLFFLSAFWALLPIPAVSATSIMAHKSLQNNILLKTVKHVFNCLPEVSTWMFLSHLATSLSQTGCFPCSSPPKSFRFHSNEWAHCAPLGAQMNLAHMDGSRDSIHTSPDNYIPIYYVSNPSHLSTSLQSPRKGAWLALGLGKIGSRNYATATLA